VGLLVPVNFHVAPRISLRAACFASGQYEDQAFQKCLSNLLAIEFRNFHVDVYWDQKRSQWGLCPAELPPAGSTMPTTTLLSSSLSATANSSPTAKELAITAVPVKTSGDQEVNRRQGGSLSGTYSISASSTAPHAPTSTFQSNNADPLLTIGPYNCTASMTLNYLIGILTDYLDDTATTTDTSFVSLVLNIHAAASWNATDQPAQQPTQLPRPGNSISDIIKGNLTEELYTPQTLQFQRANLNETWFRDVAANLPAQGYYQTRQVGNTLVTDDGWPTEAFMEFKAVQRLITSFGAIDPQMSTYNRAADDATIFPPGAIRKDYPVSFRPDGSLSSGCLFTASDNYITASTNNSWVTAVVPSLDIGANPDLLSPNPTISNLTSCGVSPFLNTTLANATADKNFRPYTAYIRSYLWTWAPGEPLNSTSKDDSRNRCAAMFPSQPYSGRWRTVDCSTNLRAACQDTSTPYRWEVSSANGVYANAESLCPSGLSFSVPHTALENAHLLAALQSSSYNQSPVLVNVNSIDVQNCWVAGANSSCPYIPPADTDHARIVVVPTVAAVIIFLLAALTFFVKCASNRREDKRGRRRRMVGGWDYEGVPS
jgi:hypothetical protein